MFETQLNSRRRFISNLLGYKNGSSFIPYFDNEISMLENPYEEYERESNRMVNDKLLEKHISNVLVDQAVDLASTRNGPCDLKSKPEVHGDHIPEMYRYRSKDDPESPVTGTTLPKRNHNKSRGRARRSKEGGDTAKYERDAPPGSEIVMCNSTPMISLPLPLLKQYMLSEVEARVRGIHDYYERQHDKINRDRMGTLCQLIEAKEHQKCLEEQLAAVFGELECYKTQCQQITSKVSAAKEAKRRRRKNKKQKADEQQVASDAGMTSRSQEADDKGQGLHDNIHGNIDNKADFNA